MESVHPLRLWIERQGLKQYQFARQIGRTEVTVSRWINGRRMPRKADMIKVEKETNGAVRPGDWYGVEAAA